MVATKTKDLVNPDPFCDVDLEVLTMGGKESNKAVVRLKDPETNAMVALDTLGAIHNRQSYCLIPNRRLKQAADDVISRCGIDFEPLPTVGSHGPTLWDGKKYTDRYYSKSISADISDGKGSRLMLGMQVTNSYDGSMSASMEFFVMNIRCANQFHSGHLIAGFNMRHHLKDGNELQIDIDDAASMLQSQASEFSKIIPRFNALTGTPLSTLGGGDTLQGYLNVRNKLSDVWKPSFEPQLMDELAGRGVSSRLKLEPTGTHQSLWGLLNAYSAVATHHIGGFNGMNINREITDRILDMVPAPVTK
jgi:hypothetical protein